MPGIERLTITLPAGMAAAMKEAVESGDYASVSEVAREALREWRIKRIMRQQELAAFKIDLPRELAGPNATKPAEQGIGPVVTRASRYA